MTKILLSAAVQYLSAAAADANMKLHSEYAEAARKAAEADEGRLMFFPPPLAITDVKLSFSANVSRSDAPGGDLLLDFGKPANFRSEIKIAPAAPRRRPLHSFEMADISHISDDSTTVFNDDSEASYGNEPLYEPTDALYEKPEENTPGDIPPYDDEFDGTDENSSDVEYEDYGPGLDNISEDPPEHNAERNYRGNHRGRHSRSFRSK